MFLTLVTERLGVIDEINNCSAVVNTRLPGVGTRYDVEGLCEFILKWLELTDLTRKFTEEA